MSSTKYILLVFLVAAMSIIGFKTFAFDPRQEFRLEFEKQKRAQLRYFLECKEYITRCSCNDLRIMKKTAGFLMYYSQANPLAMFHDINDVYHEFLSPRCDNYRKAFTSSN